MKIPWKWPWNWRLMVSADFMWSIWTVRFSHHVVNYRTLEQIAVRTSLIIDFGGGVKSDEDLVIAFENGAQMVTGGSIAVKNPELFCKWLQMYGSEKIILGADVKEHKIASMVGRMRVVANCFRS